jgi:hypothetical protein
VVGEGEEMARGPVGNSPVGVLGIGTAAAVLLLAAALLLYVLVATWPPEPSTAGTAAPTTYPVALFTLPLTMSRETGLFLIVASVGALGGMVHSLRSFYWYVGNRDLKWSWMLMYLMVPVVGALIAVVFYVVLRGGLISGQASSAAVSPFGFAAVAGLVGLFSDQAVLKLQQVFSVLFTPAEQGRDHAPVAVVDVTGFSPDGGPVGTPVTVEGSGFKDAFEVGFGPATAVPAVLSDAQLTVTVPAGAVTGPITVRTPMGSATSSADFVVGGP